VTESLLAAKEETSVTTYAATAAGNRPQQLVKEDAGFQLSWTLVIKGEWHDDETTPYPDPDA